jgi:tetratricopeptide (TPR) repeat protein
MTPEALVKFGTEAMHAGRFDEAAGHFARAVEKTPHLASLHDLLGRALGMCGRMKEAEAAFARAVELDPANVTFLLGLALSIQKQGRLDDTLATLRRAVAAHPKHAQAWNELGIALGMLQDNGAFDAFERSVALEPDFGQAHYNLGLAYRKANFYGRAAERLERAAALLAAEPGRLDGARGVAGRNGPVGGRHQLLPAGIGSAPRFRDRGR